MRNELVWRFGYHPADPVTAQRHEAIRAAMLRAAYVVQELVEDRRERALAITKLEEAMMWANAGIAREDK